MACLMGLSTMPAQAEINAQGATTMPATQRVTTLSVGNTAPAFTLESTEGKTLSLGDFPGSKAIILYFYPKADTPGCTKEACGFRDASAQYKEMNLTVLGISPDPKTDIDKFSGKYSLNFPLLADPDHAVCEKYGVWTEKNNYGRKYWGAARTTFVIKDGKIIHIFEKVKPEGHEAEVLAWIRENLK
jgi:peroxiredoxin Q/BCP